MSDVTMVVPSLTLIVLTWTVVKINERIGETQRMMKQMVETKDHSPAGEVNTKLAD